MKSVDVEQYWSHKETSPSITELADQNIITEMAMELKKKATVLYNEYQGLPGCRQLEETVAEFLKRLPPASPRLQLGVPWIRIANPFRPRPRSISGKHDPDDLNGPPLEDGTEKHQLVLLCENLLEELTDDVREIAKELKGQVLMTLLITILLVPLQPFCLISWPSRIASSICQDSMRPPLANLTTATDNGYKGPE